MIDATADYSLHYHRGQMLSLLRDYDARYRDYYTLNVLIVNVVFIQAKLFFDTISIIVHFIGSTFLG